MIKTKASLIVMSHLSDAQEEVKSKDPFVGSIIMRLNFAKYLIFHLGGDLSQEIDADEWFARFQASQTNKEG